MARGRARVGHRRPAGQCQKPAARRRGGHAAAWPDGAKTRPAGPGEPRGGESMNLFTKGLMSAAAAAALLFAAAHDNAAEAAAKCIKGDRKPPYTVGWANIYSVPTWMKQTQGTLEEIFNQLKAKGLTGKLVVT